MQEGVQKLSFFVVYVFNWELNTGCDIIIIGIQPLGRSGQRLELNQVTGMALVRCILGKFLGVVCHYFPPGCDNTGEIRRPEIIMWFQCWSKILVAGNLKMIAR